jgi:hypothetical protein
VENGTTGPASCSTILIATDDSGGVQFFVDGTFYVGQVQLTPVPAECRWLKVPSRSQFLVHCGFSPQSQVVPTLHTLFCPSSVALPLLDDQEFRSIARTSSSLRHLLWHCRNFVSELRNLWIGYERVEGAGTLGPKWLKGIEIIQRDNWGCEYVLDAMQCSGLGVYSLQIMSVAEFSNLQYSWLRGKPLSHSPVSLQGAKVRVIV